MFKSVSLRFFVSPLSWSTSSFTTSTKKCTKKYACLSELPYVKSSNEMLDAKFWKHRQLEKMNIKNAMKRVRNQSQRQIAYHMEKIKDLTRSIAVEFPQVSQLHPFEQDIVELTLGLEEFNGNIAKLDQVYMHCSLVARQYSDEISTLTTRSDTLETTEQCIQALRNAILEKKGEIDSLLNMAQLLKGLPQFNLDKPLGALVGAPNVGKSSLVKAVSSGNPEIANYPFTTRGLTVGHIFIDHEVYQVADTPGLLHRPNKPRNKIEKLALSILQHTDSAVIFVMDASGSSGTSLSEQLLLREELRQLLPEKYKHCWVDVVSKIDVPQYSNELTPLSQLPSNSKFVSSVTGEGMVDFHHAVIHVLKEASSTTFCPMS